MRKMFSEKQIEELAKDQAVAQIVNGDIGDLQIIELDVEEEEQEFEVELNNIAFILVNNPDDYSFGIKSPKILFANIDSNYGIDTLNGITDTPESRGVWLTGAIALFFCYGLLLSVQYSI